MTPPCGVPRDVSSKVPLLHTPALTGCLIITNKQSNF
jgi:hypothetical protein